MSLLACSRLHPPSLLYPSRPSDAIISVPRVGRVRSYAKSADSGGGQMRQGFRGKQTGSANENSKRTQRTGAFKPMAANQLEKPIFQTSERTELELPTFPYGISQKRPGSAMAFSKDETAIRYFGVPKNLLVDFRLLSRPCSVVRGSTVALIEKLNTASSNSSRQSRLVLTGPSGCGKSYLLLQAVEYCAANKWIVLYVPRGVSLVNSSSSYVYDPRTRTYMQPTFSDQILQRFLSVNQNVLEGLVTQKEIVLDRRVTLAAGTSLSNLINIGLKDQFMAVAVLSALMTELSKQTTHPVLLAVDDFQSLYCNTMYRSPRFEGIKPYHLSIPRLFLEYASGMKYFARGAVVGAASSAHTTFRMPLELCEALGLPYDRPSGPYVSRSPELVKYAQGLENFNVAPQLSIDEAASIFEVWKQDKALHTDADDTMFMSKYSEANGNARSFVWGGLLSTLSSL